MTDKVALGFVVAAVIVVGFAALVYSPQFDDYVTTQQALSESVPREPIHAYDTDLISQLIHNKTNDARILAGVQPVSYDYSIETAARIHAGDMVTRGYFSHDSPEGYGPDVRGIDAGYETCGDSALIELERLYYSRGAEFMQKQDILNAQKDTLNKRILANNADIRNYNLGVHDTRTDIRTFNPNQDLIDKQRIDAETASINQERLRLDRTTADILAEKAELEEMRAAVNEGIVERKTYSGFAENLAQPALYDSRWLTEGEVAQSTIDAWAASPGHNRNMLLPYHTTQGIGIVLDKENLTATVVQNFC